MGHIDEAFKRTGRIGHLIEGPHPSAAADARASAVLERYALEKAPGLDEGKLPPPTPGPWPGGSQPVDVRSSALPASVPAPAEPKGAEPKGIVEKLSKPTAGPQPAG